MRTLLIMRGAPGSGKSTFIEENDLKPYTISTDDIRLMFSSPVLTVAGNEEISQKNNKKIFEVLYAALENRMQNGAFTVIDATNAKESSFKTYVKLAQKYKYRIYCIDMSDVSLEECKKRNRQRKNYKMVPDYAIERMYEEIKDSKLPSKVMLLKPEQYKNIFYRPVDFSMWNKINVIGDVHGCYSALLEGLGETLKEDELYIFTGDYLDRGIENAETINFLLNIKDNKNVVLLEGNHEKHLKHWSNDEPAKSKLFNEITSKELNEAGVSKKSVRNLYRKLGQCVYFSYNDNFYLACHGGISSIPQNLIFVPSSDLIKGVGTYPEYEDVANTFSLTMPSNVYQISGHRNVSNSPIPVKANGRFTRCFNLEGSVENGGMLRILTLELGKKGYKETYVQNKVFNLKYIKNEENIPHDLELDNMPVGILVEYLRKNKDINEKVFGDLSSFNFSKNAFFNGNWNNQTVKARGLFIDTKQNKIAARSYEKFFNLFEIIGRPSLAGIDIPAGENDLDVIKEKLVFPISLYKKIDGFLGMVFSHNGKLKFASKSTIEGDHARYLENVMKTVYGKNVLEAIKQISETQNCTFIFECVDPENDKHIMEYSETSCILLDIVYNDTKFKKLDYKSLCDTAHCIGLTCKEKCHKLYSWNEFYKFYEDFSDENKTNYLNSTNQIEGYVIEDENGFMLKIKSPYYLFWKKMRSLTAMVCKGLRIESVNENKLTESFYNYVYKLSENGLLDSPDDISTLRNNFIKQLEN